MFKLHLNSFQGARLCPACTALPCLHGLWVIDATGRRTYGRDSPERVPH